MTKQERRAKQEKIANEHGCDVSAVANGGVAVTVQGYHQRGRPLDDERIRGALRAMEAAGVPIHNPLF